MVVCELHQLESLLGLVSQRDVKEHSAEESSNYDWHRCWLLFESGDHIFVSNGLESQEPKKQKLAEDQEAELARDHVSLNSKRVIEVRKRSAWILILVILLRLFLDRILVFDLVFVVGFLVVIFVLVGAFLDFLAALWLFRLLLFSLGVLSIVVNVATLEPVEVSCSIEVLSKQERSVDADRSIEAISELVTIGLEHALDLLVSELLLFVSLVLKRIEQLLVLFCVLQAVDEDVVGVPSPSVVVISASVGPADSLIWVVVIIV